MTIVPPEKSTPSCGPCLAIITMPAPITTSERTMACHRHLVKFTFAFVSSSMAVPLDAERARRLRARQRQLEQRPRDEDGGEHVREQADGECGGEAANRARAELEE